MSRLALGLAMFVGTALLAAGLYAVFGSVEAGLPGRWCSDAAVRAVCYRDWLGALSGWAAVIGALVAAKIAYDSFNAARVEAGNVERRHQENLRLQDRPKKEALLRLQSGVVKPLESLMSRMSMLGFPPGFGGLGGLGGAPTGSHKKALQDALNELRAVVDSELFRDAHRFLNTDIERPASRIRRIVDGYVPPRNPLLGLIAIDPLFSKFDKDDKARLEGVKYEAELITSVIRQEMMAAGLMDESNEEEQTSEAV